MTAYLGYSYSIGLKKPEIQKIDQRIKNSKQEFIKGFLKGISLSITIQCLYSFITYPAYAENQNLPKTAGKTPEKTLIRPKLGFRSLYTAILTGGVTFRDDLYFGMLCGFVLAIANIIINEYKESKKEKVLNIIKFIPIHI